jgi:hypothetical protein
MFLTIAVSLAFLPSVSNAGCYSDHCANKRSGATSSSLTLKYGGGYTPAAKNKLNYERGYGTGKNDHIYSPYLPAYRSGGYRAPTTTPAQRRQINQAIQRADRMIKFFENNPKLYGGY